MAKLNMDLSGVKEETSSAFSLVPAGDYEVKVVSADVKETKSGGAGLILGLEILSGDQSGKKIKDFINIVNSNVDAERIGKQRLKLIAMLVGVKNPNKVADTDELLTGKPVVVSVDVRDDGEYKNNVIKHYFPSDKKNEEVKTETKVATSKKPWEK